MCVVVRGGRGIRATIRGYLDAYDKHWNMILSAVQEESASLIAEEDSCAAPSRELQRMLPKPPESLQWSASVVRYEQLLLRGGNTVMVRVMR